MVLQHQTAVSHTIAPDYCSHVHTTVMVMYVVAQIITNAQMVTAYKSDVVKCIIVSVPKIAVSQQRAQPYCASTSPSAFVDQITHVHVWSV